MSKIIQDQLKKVQLADLSKFDAATNTFIIPKRSDIKIEEDCCYLIKIRASAKINAAVNINWNNGNAPIFDSMKIDVSKKMGKMVKVTGLKHDLSTNQDYSQFWNGWLSLDDVEVISKL